MGYSVVRGTTLNVFIRVTLRRKLDNPAISVCFAVGSTFSR
jgi:hypothetical protein